MRHEEVGDLLEFLFWMRDRILAAAAELTDDEFAARETVTSRDLRATLAHQLENEWAWRVRLKDGSFPDGDILAADYPNLGALKARWHLEERDLRGWFAGLSNRELASPAPGDDNPLALWRYLIYVVNHGTQQFAEAAVLLTRLGHSPGEIGYLAFCSEPSALSQSSPSA
jgi:Uncharacterized protein conserved in bacteria